jgi:Na+-driven multidrug efflux pump
MAMGIDQASSELAYTYVTTMLPGVLLNSYADSIDLFLIAMNFTFGIVVIQLLVIPVHIGFCYLFVEKFNMGVKGAA